MTQEGWGVNQRSYAKCAQDTWSKGPQHYVTQASVTLIYCLSGAQIATWGEVWGQGGRVDKQGQAGQAGACSAEQEGSVRQTGVLCRGWADRGLSCAMLLNCNRAGT